MITLTMAVLETSDRTLLAVFGEQRHHLRVWCTFRQAEACERIGVPDPCDRPSLGALLRTAQDIEAMDDFGRKYEEVRTNRLGGWRTPSRAREFQS